MEKISNIVRGNARVASTDLKSSSAARPGTPGFGRPVADSQVATEKVGTTASRAVALHNELEEKRASQKDQVVSQMADQFFMTRVRRPPEEEGAESVMEKVEHSPELSASSMEDEIVVPKGYTPRGSFIDKQA